MIEKIHKSDCPTYFRALDSPLRLDPDLIFEMRQDAILEIYTPTILIVRAHKYFVMPLNAA